jgi:hypothetical protein
MAATSENNHVQFDLDDEELKSHHEQVEIFKRDEHQYTVNLGYLKVDHYYMFSFDLNDYYAESFSYLNDQSSSYIKFKGLVKKSNSLHTMTFICFTHKEENEQDDVYFRVVRKDAETGLEETLNLQITFEAKVLGAHQGTPSLRKGVHSYTNEDRFSHFTRN